MLCLLVALQVRDCGDSNGSVSCPVWRRMCWFTYRIYSIVSRTRWC